MMKWCDILAACAVLLAAAACGGDDSMSRLPSDQGDVEAGELGNRDACPGDTRPFTFGATGLSDTNEAVGIKVYLEDASHMPPAYDFNDWTIAFTDLAGNPLPDAKLTFACAWMGAHDHGSNPRQVEKLSDGRYRLIAQNMAMHGGWEIKLWVDPSGTGADYKGGGASIGTKACMKPMSDPTLTLKACVPQ